MHKNLLQPISGIILYGFRIESLGNNLNLVTMYYGFQRAPKHILGNLNINGLDSGKY